MTIKAIFFGSIGTLVETSGYQRQAFNQAFKEAGLDWKWDVEEYKSLLTTSGGRQRIATYAEGRQQTVDAEALHDRKTQIFDEFIIEQGLSLRRGVLDVIQSAKTKGIKLAFVTSTSRENIDAIFQALEGEITKDDFAFVGDASMVSNSKPHSEIYDTALLKLGLKPDQCVAIEDTPVSMKSAIAAGIRCVGFTGEFADEDDFNAASNIVSNLTIDDLLNVA